MTLKIGDFVLQDGCVAIVDRFVEEDDDYRGFALNHDARVMNWWISPKARKINIQDLEYIRDMILTPDRYQSISITNPETKDFINKLAKWCLINLT